ncbi:hypothetical protein [Vibrio vulnificus]|uniref:hypothetical protein n=1 Tax=Vibrio vulnificus TaxID=672 RepID=UPI003F666BCC
MHQSDDWGYEFRSARGQMINTDVSTVFLSGNGIGSFGEWQLLLKERAINQYGLRAVVIT